MASDNVVFLENASSGSEVFSPQSNQGACIVNEPGVVIPIRCLQSIIYLLSTYYFICQLLKGHKRTLEVICVTISIGYSIMRVYVKTHYDMYVEIYVKCMQKGKRTF